jgi:hypothetical protein
MSCPGLNLLYPGHSPVVCRKACFPSGFVLIPWNLSTLLPLSGHLLHQCKSQCNSAYFSPPFLTHHYPTGQSQSFFSAASASALRTSSSSMQISMQLSIFLTPFRFDVRFLPDTGGIVCRCSPYRRRTDCTYTCVDSIYTAGT